MRDRAQTRPDARGVLLLLAALMSVQVLASCDRGLPDQEITAAVEREAGHDPVVAPYHVTATTNDGIVTLRGVTSNLLAKERSERIAETVRGVRAVVNLVEVEPPAALPDDRIQQDVHDALAMNPALRFFDITTSVEDGMVTLSGTVNSRAAWDLAGTVAKGVRGVREVRNEMDIEWDVARLDWEIEQEVRESLRFDVLVDHGLMDVQVVDGRVILDGIVGSAAERRQARYNAWVAGVTSVDDSGLTVARWARDEDLRKDRYVALPDEEIEDALELALIHDPRVLGSNVHVSSDNGVLTLTGTVMDLRARRGAEETAENTLGVIQVDNHLEVWQDTARADSAIVQDLLRAFDRDPLLHDEDIAIRISAGIVTLSGSVESSYISALAADVAARVEGVVGIVNNLMVGDDRPFLRDPYLWRFDPGGVVWDRPLPYLPEMSDVSIRESIEQELFWSPFVDEDHIAVTVDDGVATLTGYVTSPRESETATLNAYQGGAVWVENELVVLDPDRAP
jgi:osmotically-inducible protein OsmY